MGFKSMLLTKNRCLLLFLLFFCGCARFEGERNPSEEKQVLFSEDAILKAFEFQSSTELKKGKDYRKIIQKYIDDIALFKVPYGVQNEITLEFVKDDSLPSGVAYVPEFRVKENTYKIIILHSSTAARDAVASTELYNFLQTLGKKNYFLHHFSAFEMYYNALEKDPVAVLNWIKIREISARIDGIGLEFSDPHVGEILKDRADEWAKEQFEYLPKVREKLKVEKELEKKRRVGLDALDKIKEGEQFKNLVAKNDRKGVVNLLKKYLPWEKMPPFETKYWETYLDAMANPLPLEQRVFLYRGVSDDLIYSAYEKGSEMEKETAKKEGKVFFMSTLMTENQGSWNRRLRSLTAMYDKFIAAIGNTGKLETEFAQSARIITMFVNHSANPQGSPFLSLTPNFETANTFGDKKISALLIDPRVLSFNFVSNFKDEFEFLLPLMTFPEDVAAYFDLSVHEARPTNKEVFLKSQFKKNLITKYGEDEGAALYLKVMKNSKNYFDTALDRYHGKMTAFKGGEVSIVAKFYNQIFKKKPEGIKAGSGCMDIMTSFWQ